MPRFDHAPLAVPEPFSRRDQRGGLVLGELLFAGGIALLLAGAATLLSPRSRSPLRLWILAGTAGLVGVVLYPALVYPPLPPGVASGLEIGDRQLLYLVTVGLGIGAVAAAARVASRSWRGVAAAATCLVVPALLAVALLPDQRAADTIGHRAAGGVPRGVDREPGPVLGHAHRGRRAAAAPPGVGVTGRRSASVARAAKADVAGRAVGRVALPGRDPVAPAVGGVAEVRAALLDLEVPLAGPRGSWPRSCGEPRIEPVGGPLPDVAGHVVQAVAVGREGVHGQVP